MSTQRHTVYNVVGAVLPMAVSLVTIPIYLELIGAERYGVLAITWLLLGYFVLFDFGLGRATAQRISALGGGRSEDSAHIFWTALIMNSGFGILGGITIFPIAVYFFKNVFVLETALSAELFGAIPWLILAVPLTTISGVLTGALQGRSQFLELNITLIAGSSLTQILPLIVAFYHAPDLIWLIPTVLLSKMLTMLVLFARCRRHVFSGYKIGVSKSIAIEMLRYGGWITLSSIISPLMVILDRFIIGAVLGAKAVAYYTIPFQLAERTTILSGSMAAALFPRLSAADTFERDRLLEVSIRSLAAISTPAMIVGFFLIEPFLSVWLGPDFATSTASTAQILLLGFWINGYGQLTFASLQAAGKPHITAIIHFIELVPYLLLLYFGLNFYGLQGVAIAFGLRTLADTILLSWFSGTFLHSFRTLRMPIILILSAFSVAIFLPVENILWWPSIAVSLLTSLIWSWKNSPNKIKRTLFNFNNSTKLDVD